MGARFEWLGMRAHIGDGYVREERCTFREKERERESERKRGRERWSHRERVCVTERYH